MPQYTTTQFKALFGNNGSLFPDNITEQITEGTMRNFGEAIADSFGNILDGNMSSIPIAKVYNDIPAMIADQAVQQEGFLYWAVDATADSTVDAGWGVYRKLAASTASLTNYVKVQEQESLDVSIPDATETVKGAAKLFPTVDNVARRIDGAPTERAVVDYIASNSISVPDATNTTKGVAKLLSSVNESIPRTDGAVREDALVTYVNSKVTSTTIPDASETTKGKAKLYPSTLLGTNTDGAPDQNAVKNYVDNAVAAVSKYKGRYPSITSLQATHPTAVSGDYAIVDPGAGTNAVIHIWDVEEGWIAGGAASTGGSVLEKQWKFSININAADPGNGLFRANNATIASITALYFSQNAQNSFDAGAIFGVLEKGNRIVAQQQNDAAKLIEFEIANSITDNGTWWTIPVIVVDHNNLLFDSSATCSVLFDVSKPAQSIPDATDSTKGIAKLFSAVNTSAPQTDGAVSEAALVPFVNTQINNAVTGLWDDRGNYDASGNTFPAAGGSGNAGAILKGDIWTVSVAGSLGGVAVTPGDTVRALTDAPGQMATNWAINEGQGVPEATPTVKGTAKLFDDVNETTPRIDGAVRENAMISFVTGVKAPEVWGIAGNITINGVNCLLIPLDCKNRAESKFSGGTNSTTPLAIDLLNFPVGAFCQLTIQRSTATNVLIRFKDKTYNVGGYELINSGKDPLTVYGVPTGLTQAILGIYRCAETGAQTNETTPVTNNVVNLIRLGQDSAVTI